MSTFTDQYVHVYRSICPRLPINMSTFTLHKYTYKYIVYLTHVFLMCTYE